MNIKEIAKKAKVSHMTVSRVLNNLPNVKEETRQKVMKIIKINNYSLNIPAKALRLGSKFSIGILIHFDIEKFYPSSIFFQELLVGISTELRSIGYTINLFFEKEPSDIDQTMSLIKLKEKEIDGLIILSNENAPYLGEKIKKINIPIVVVNQDMGISNFDYVLSDDENGAYEATKYLINLKHKSIAYIDGPSKNRRDGYLRALKDFNLDPDISLIENGYYSKNGGYKAMEKILKRRKNVTAVFSANDFMALGAISTIKGNNLKIPEDISVVGFDDLELIDFIEPSLTTVKKPRRLMGEKSVLLLFDRLKSIKSNKEKASKKVILQTKLIIRDSTKAIN